MHRLTGVALLGLGTLGIAQEATRFEVTFHPALQERLATGYEGRVFVALTRTGAEPRVALHDWFAPAQVFARDVRVGPGEAITFAAGDDSLLSDPRALEELAPGRYSVQAIVRIDPDGSRAGLGRGDLTSAVRQVDLPTEVELVLEHVTAGPDEPEDPPWEWFELRSTLLSGFHGRALNLRAAVLLPDGWHDEPERQWPVVWFVMGFAQDHIDGARMFAQRRAGAARDVLLVFPDPTCGHGHCVFTDSATNGPWGRALVEELAPALEERFRGARAGAHRYVAGGSSGGWAALSLQVSFPEAFAGCWSFAPDPVDFRSFLGADLYAAGANVYRAPDGTPRPFMTIGGRTHITVEAFARRELVLGRGGQLGSLEAVFSPRVDGAPRRLFDRATGAVDPETVRAWRASDLSVRLSTGWEELDLGGKLHVWAGDRDEFDLDGAVALLRERLSERGARAEVEVVEGLGHRLHQPALQALFETAVARWEER